MARGQSQPRSGSPADGADRVGIDRGVIVRHRRQRDGADGQVFRGVHDIGPPLGFIFLEGLQGRRQPVDRGVPPGFVEVGRVDLTLPDDIPYWFLCLPQYSTERILTERLTELGTTVERGVGLTAFEQSDDAVTCTLSDGSTVTARYLVGSDGAHSVVRKGLGLSFEGGAFAESYMLGDVEVDWSIPSGYSVRANHTADDGTTDDLLVCIPLPGHKRYRMSMLVPDELMPDESSNKAAVQHGFSTGKTPELHHIQAVLDRLSPEPTTASMLRWSSVFRISHRIVDAYSRGRVFVAGDAAHIHPPTGAQGMNTGIQDAHNLAWKIALAVKGVAKADLLETYDAERRPVGEEVVGMTVRNAREGIGSGESSIDTAMRRQAQLLIDYSESPLNTGRNSSSPHVQPGERAPDARGMRRDGVQYPIRLFDLLSGVDHTLLLTSDGSAESINSLEKVADAAIRSAHGLLDVYAIVPPGTVTVDSLVPIIEELFWRAWALRSTNRKAKTTVTSPTCREIGRAHV